MNAPATAPPAPPVTPARRHRLRRKLTVLIASIGLVAGLFTAAPIVAPAETGALPTAEAISTRCSWRYGYPPCRIFLNRSESAALMRASVPVYGLIGGAFGGPIGAALGSWLAAEAVRYASRARPCIVLGYPYVSRTRPIRVMYARSC